MGGRSRRRWQEKERLLLGVIVFIFFSAVALVSAESDISVVTRVQQEEGEPGKNASSVSSRHQSSAVTTGGVMPVLEDGYKDISFSVGWAEASLADGYRHISIFQEEPEERGELGSRTERRRSTANNDNSKLLPKILRWVSLAFRWVRR